MYMYTELETMLSVSKWVLLAVHDFSAIPGVITIPADKQLQ